ncbi:MAG: hypothetical protein SFW67_01820 [Myxococcaceae bacterium]|nr:hypothetical protein [Myxococcaceae bacterium]
MSALPGDARQAQVRGRELRQRLGELPQLDDRGDRIVREVALRERAERDQQRVVDGEKLEVG